MAHPIFCRSIHVRLEIQLRFGNTTSNATHMNQETLSESNGAVCCEHNFFITLMVFMLG